LCTACPVGCKVCTSAISCSTCTTGFYIAGSSCLACTSNCLTCTVAGCTMCNSLSTLISGLCFFCTDLSKSGSSGCQTCITVSNLISCSKCADNYYINIARQCILCASTFPNSVLCSSSAPIQCLNDHHATLTTRNHFVNGQCISNTKSCKKIANALGDCSQCYFEGPDSYFRLSSN